ncbi:hypothetical protein LCGC14_0395680 [marine sediment metagenome]|uniref:Uncharacterized protein n=1 Tax=marine sediment metagenome TaxID=412755 RepID=A0A0F9TGH0_9ZZZZ
MRNAEKIIDELIKEFAEDLPTLVIQKLGEIRKALTTEEFDDSSGWEFIANEDFQKLVDLMIDECRKNK